MPGCLGHFVRLPSYLAGVLHLVMHIPLWNVTGGNVQQKHPGRTDWKLLEQPVHPCKDNSTPLETSSIPKHKKDSYKHRQFLIQHSKRVENYGIRSISLNNIVNPLRLLEVSSSTGYCPIFKKFLQFSQNPLMTSNSQIHHAFIREGIIKSITFHW